MTDENEDENLFDPEFWIGVGRRAERICSMLGGTASRSEDGAAAAAIAAGQIGADPVALRYSDTVMPPRMRTERELRDFLSSLPFEALWEVVAVVRSALITGDGWLQHTASGQLLARDPSKVTITERTDG